MFKFQYQNGKKQKSGKKFSGLQNGDYKQGQEGLQIAAAGDISNQGRATQPKVYGGAFFQK